MRTAIETVTKPMDVVIERCGTKSFPEVPGPIEIRTSVAYTKVATNVPSVNWVPRSRMKFRSILGPNCVEASASVTIMIENTIPTTAITAAASVVSIWRAASAVPNTIHDGSVMLPLTAALSSARVTKYSATATTTSIIGTSQRLVRAASRRHSERNATSEITEAEVWSAT